MLLPRKRGHVEALAPCLTVLALSICLLGGLAQRPEDVFGPGGQQLASEDMVARSDSELDSRLHGGRSLKDGSLFWQHGETNAHRSCHLPHSTDTAACVTCMRAPLFPPGSLVVNMQDLMAGGDGIAYLLRTEDDSVVHIIGQETEYSKLPPGEGLTKTLTCTHTLPFLCRDALLPFPFSFPHRPAVVPLTSSH
jgi:hypothetical protein